MSDGQAAVLAAIAQLGNELGGRMDRLESEVIRLRVDFMGRLDRQQDMLTSIRDDIAVNMAATGRTQKANGETRQDMLQLTEQVSLIHRRLIQLEERVDRSELRP